jgi:hypothetical protein
MTLSITSPHDGGNIRWSPPKGDRFDLEIVQDHASDFFNGSISGSPARPDARWSCGS